MIEKESSPICSNGVSGNTTTSRATRFSLMKAQSEWLMEELSGDIYTIADVVKLIYLLILYVKFALFLNF